MALVVEQSTVQKVINPRKQRNKSEIWSPRNQSPISSLSEVVQTNNSEEVEECKSVVELGNKDSRLITKLEKIKVTSKRGRPRKIKKERKINKYFQIPERYKSSNVTPINTHGLSGKELEAAQILETGELLGLYPVSDRNEMLKKIQIRLLD